MKIRILAAIAVLLAASSVQALPTVSIIWKQTGTNVIDAASNFAPGDLVNANIVVTADPVADPSIVGVFLTIEFNNAKLDVSCGGGSGPPNCGGFEIPVVNLPGMGNTWSPIGLGVDCYQAGAPGTFPPALQGVPLCANFDVANASAPGLNSGNTRTIGSITFELLDVSGGVTDIDVIASINNAGADSISVLDNTVDPAAAFNSAGTFESAAVVPEPVSSVLGGAALLTLLGLKRRRARR